MAARGRHDAADRARQLLCYKNPESGDMELATVVFAKADASGQVEARFETGQIVSTACEEARRLVQQFKQVSDDLTGREFHVLFTDVGRTFTGAAGRGRVQTDSCFVGCGHGHGH